MLPHSKPARLLDVSGYIIDVQRREISIGLEAFKPDTDAFDTLVYLIEKRDHIVDLSEFRNALWHDRTATEFEITRAVMLARKAIGDDVEKSQIRFHAEHNGYQFTGEVLELEIDAN